MFSSSIQEKLDRYVYRLVDPRTDKTFYVGKGIGNRMFQHDQSAMSAGQSNDTIERIREIEAAGKQVIYAVHRHGLTEEQALEVEAALIDAYGLKNLTNVVPGIDSERGNMTVDEIKSLYEPESTEINEPAIFIKVNRLWYRDIPEDELYAITRGYWNCRPDNRRVKPRYAFSIKDGIVRQVYEIVGDWQQADASMQPPRNEIERQLWAGATPPIKENIRSYFDGRVAEDKAHYVGKSVKHLFSPNAQNPIKYVNC